MLRKPSPKLTLEELEPRIAPTVISMVSVDSNGNQGNGGLYGGSFVPAISADGRYVAFVSGASNLVSGDTNGTYDAFVHDMVTATTTRVSVDSSGNQGDNDSYGPAISTDGRYVAFGSLASNLVSGDTNGTLDVFAHDMITGTTTRVSVDSNGNEGNSASFVPAISTDGRYIAFTSHASNLVSGDTNGTYDVFVHDMVTRATTRVSVDSNGNQADSNSFYPVISADGRYVAFHSQASNLVPGDTNGTYDVFVHDMVTGATTRVSVDSSGNQGDGESDLPAISTDGRYIAFTSHASNLVSGDTNGTYDVFVHDMVTRATTRVSVDSNGNQGDNDSYGLPAISTDGRYIAFTSDASNLVSGDTNGTRDVFLFDMVTGATTRVSVDSSGNQGNNDSLATAISPDGRYVAFESDASNLVPGDTNGVYDAFVAHLLPHILVTDSSGLPDGHALDFSLVQADGHGHVLATETVTITNDGTYPLTLTGMSLAAGTNFQVSSLPANPLVLDPGATQQVTVTFDPLALGTLADTLTILSDDPQHGAVPLSLVGRGYYAHSWQQGPVTVTVCDMSGGVDLNPDDVRVRFGRNDSVSSIRFGGSLSMDGVGIIIHGASSVGSIVDARTGPIGDLSFIASDGPIANLRIAGPVAGYNLNGLSLGGIDFNPDIDGDGYSTDLTAFYVHGDLRTATVRGEVGGDVLVGGSVNRLQTTSSLLGDLHVTGEATNLHIGGDLGVADRTFEVDGLLKSLTVGTRAVTGHLFSDLVVAGDLTRVTIYGDLRGAMEVGGKLGSLTVAGALTGDVAVHGDLANAVVGRDLGAVGSTFEVGGILRALTVGSRTASGHVLSDLVVAGNLTRATIYGDLRGEVEVGGNLGNLVARHITSSIAVAGNLNSLTTTSTVAAGVPPVDHVFQNADPEPDGQLLVAGSIGRVR